MVMSRRNEWRYAVGLVPELVALGMKVSVLLCQSKLSAGKNHLQVDQEFASLIQGKFPFVAVELVKVGEEVVPGIVAREAKAVFFSVSPPDAFEQTLFPVESPWIQIQHGSDLFVTNGFASKKADGFLLWGKEWISERVRGNPILSSFHRNSIDYVRSKPFVFAGHFGLNAPSACKIDQDTQESDEEDSVVIFDHAIELRGRSDLHTLARSVSLLSKYPSEIGDIRRTFKKLGEKLKEEKIDVAIRPRLKGVPLPLGYPAWADRTELQTLDDDPSYQILASRGIVSFFPSQGILEALYLGRAVLGIDWQRLINPSRPYHSGLQKVWCLELQNSSFSGFRMFSPISDEFSLRDFFGQSVMRGSFDLDGWISVGKIKNEQLDKLLFELSGMQ